MVRLTIFCLVLLLAMDELLSLQENGTGHIVGNAIGKKIKRTRRNDARSTSSSSGSRKKGKSKSQQSKDSKETLELTSIDTSSNSKTKKYARKSSEERKGWRKWHRKCHPCPEEMALKWRDPSIKWICGAYQRAQRSFKSACMMYYRNCQDGTMFVKIHDHRCTNDTDRVGEPRGEHFFYDYRVKISEESSKTDSESDTSSETKSTDIDMYNYDFR